MIDEPEYIIDIAFEYLGESLLFRENRLNDRDYNERKMSD